jgi:type II secretion system protein G
MSRNKNKKTKYGFTLIELLIVIAIIGLLASIVLVSLSSARQKSRISKRAADLKQIQTALELYYNDNAGYPNPGWAWHSQCNAWGPYSSANVIPGLVPGYIANMPADPSMLPAANQNCYLYLSNGADYKFMAYNIADMQPADLAKVPSFVDPIRDSGYAAPPCGGGDGTMSMAVYTVGGRCW